MTYVVIWDNKQSWIDSSVSTIQAGPSCLLCLAQHKVWSVSSINTATEFIHLFIIFLFPYENKEVW